MALSIKDPEAELLVRVLAKRRGVSLTQAVLQAVRSELESDGLPESERIERLEGGQRWLAKFCERHSLQRPIRSMTKQKMADLIQHDKIGLG